MNSVMLHSDSISDDDAGADDVVVAASDRGARAPVL